MSVQRVARSGMLRGVVQWSAALAVLGLLALDTPVRAADSGWPRQFDSPSGSFVIYQPQPEDLDGDLLYSRAAFSLQKSADANPIFGVLWFNEHIEIDRDSSTVVGRELDVSKVRLPGITAAEAGRYEALVESEATQWDLPGSLEELKAGLAATEKERASVAGLDNTPPRIQFVYERAFLVPYDGAPMLEPIEGSSLEWVVNTPYAVILDPARHEYYLSGPDLWYRAKDPLGPWVVTASPPASVRAVMPPDTSSRDQVEGPPPRVFTATTPTELVARSRGLAGCDVNADLLRQRRREFDFKPYTDYREMLDKDFESEHHRKFRVNRSLRDVEPQVNLFLKDLSGIQVEDPA